MVRSCRCVLFILREIICLGLRFVFRFRSIFVEDGLLGLFLVIVMGRRVMVSGSLGFFGVCGFFRVFL